VLLLSRNLTVLVQEVDVVEMWLAVMLLRHQ
jgi:hypothetical protein